VVSDTAEHPDPEIRAITGVIDDAVSDLEESAGLSIPRENCKNIYTKACWIVSRLQTALPFALMRSATDPEKKVLFETTKDNIEYIRGWLPRLREAVK